MMIRSMGFAIFLMGLMLGVAAPVSADEYGVVDDIHHGERIVVVDDWAYHLDRSSRLHTAETQDASWLNLRVGDKVRITVKPRSEDRRDVVAEMWILPAGND